MTAVRVGVKRGLRARASTYSGALAVITLSLISLVLPAASARAADLPLKSDPVYFQTQGPNARITRGDYYSATVAQGGAGTNHVISFETPLYWPATRPITVSIYDPESSGGRITTGLRAYDEIAGAPDATSFSVVQRPSGTIVGAKNYPSGTTSTHNKWDQVVTFVPVAGATYEIHATTSDNDDNAWRGRATYDPDCAVGTATCTAAQLDNGNEVDDIDGVPGTGDEILLNPVRVAYQHDVSPQSCSDLFFFVGEGQTQVATRNFDLDRNGSVLFTRPDGTTVGGTTSSNGAWANDTISVGSGQSGWWKVRVCASATNLYVFESTTGETLFPQLPGSPQLAVTKTDGVSSALWGDTLNYTVTVANTSNLRPNPGSAVGVVVRDQVPAGLTYTGCSMGGAAGSCTESGGVVTWTLLDPILAGTSVNLSLSATVNAGSSGTVVNTAVADFSDVYGNNYPDVSGSDSVDTMQPPSISLKKTTLDALTAGGTITYLLTAENTGNVALTNVQISDGLTGATVVGNCDAVTLAPGGTTSCTVQYVASQADVDAGSLTNSASVSGLPPTGGAVAATDAVTLVATPAPALTLTKTASASDVSAGDVITYTLTALNAGNVTLSAVSIADSLTGLAFEGDCSPTTLAPGAALTCTAVYTVTPDDVDAGTIVNDATATGTPPSGSPVSDASSVSVTASGTPAIDVVVNVNRPKYGSFGEVLTFTVMTTNTGNVTLFNTRLASTLPGADSGECDAIDVTLAPGASATCTVYYEIVLSDLYLPQKALEVVATGNSKVLVAVKASSAASATPVQALAFTGANVIQPTAYAGGLILAGMIFVLLASHSRRKGNGEEL